MRHQPSGKLFDFVESLSLSLSVSLCLCLSLSLGLSVSLSLSINVQTISSKENSIAVDMSITQQSLNLKRIAFRASYSLGT